MSTPFFVDLDIVDEPTQSDQVSPKHIANTFSISPRYNFKKIILQSIISYILYTKLSKGLNNDECMNHPNPLSAGWNIGLMAALGFGCYKFSGFVLNLIR